MRPRDTSNRPLGNTSREKSPLRFAAAASTRGTLYAIVLGPTGVTLGLALYRGWDDVLAMLQGLRGNDEMSGFSIVFDEVAIMAPVRPLSGQAQRLADSHAGGVSCGPVS